MTRYSEPIRSCLDFALHVAKKNSQNRKSQPNFIASNPAIECRQILAFQLYASQLLENDRSLFDPFLLQLNFSLVKNLDSKCLPKLQKPLQRHQSFRNHSLNQKKLNSLPVRFPTMISLNSLPILVVENHYYLGLLQDYRLVHFDFYFLVRMG